MKKIFLLPVLMMIYFFSSSQQSNYKIAVVAFYNCEHFTDTIQKFFGENSSKRVYTPDMYKEKLNNITTAIASIGKNETKAGAALLGVADVGSHWVLNDIVHHSSLKDRNYEYVIGTQKGNKNIDVALIYNPVYFSVETSKPLFASVKVNDKFYLSNILYVKGKLNGEVVHVFVNHWAWKTTDKQNNDAARWKAAMLCRSHIEGILEKDSTAKILLLGTFNDEPTDYSLTEILKADDDIKNINPSQFYNPWNYFKKKVKIGSTLFNSQWAMFDQIILSKSFLDKQQNGWFYYQSKIFNDDFLCEKKGSYAGFPSPTWIGDDYHGGAGNHFPVYISVLKKL